MAEIWPPQITNLAAATAYRAAKDERVKLAPLRDPDRLLSASTFFAVWEPGGARQPLSHSASVTTFLFLSGDGMARCDEVAVPVRAGQMLVVPPGSVYSICNDGSERLYGVMTITPDDGFANFVRSGEPADLDAEDLAVLHIQPAPRAEPETFELEVLTSELARASSW